MLQSYCDAVFTQKSLLKNFIDVSYKYQGRTDYVFNLSDGIADICFIHLCSFREIGCICISCVQLGLQCP